MNIPESNVGTKLQKIADEVFEGVLRDAKELTSLPYVFAHMIRVELPWLYHLFMARKAQEYALTSPPQRY